jgi:acyl transferase domain-containing protein/NAD(P)H-dependent flavin oxidoreductase YrpB (nitropropane dioxygenase family)
VLVEVRSLEEAEAAVGSGASGLIARGVETGGLVGDETTFVLLQQLVGSVDLPVWAAGGIGIHTAAAAIAGGAVGVVLDSQLALVRESTLPDEVRSAIRAMDGSETTVVASHRVYVRPDLPTRGLGAEVGAEHVALGLGGDDLHTQFVPVGQDGSFASALTRRYPTAGSLVHGVRRQISQHLTMARSHDPLAPESRWAVSHDLHYPVAQGPMTRVSDRAAFADEVARAGGLPFLALALMTGGETRSLLEETAAVLGDRSWGVGILGFVPPEVREEQLEVVHDIRPPVALVAGGRPSQARPLEEAGIATYLHVPSPGLLERFLREGARRFVFEGRECGGHVGPRSSFALWDAQVETLLASDHVGDTSVLFAGGVHDGRSAAMVAALAAPLVDVGARIGVLMGTAYLFTEEAVDAGAIVPGFQQAALASRATALLETAPGHSTRCAATEYVATFEAERRRLEAGGTDAKEAWAALEGLNLGRLRIATKGLARDSDRLVDVSAEDQSRQGMYMMGAVAALRDQVTSLASLHRDVSEGSSEVLAGLDEVAKEVGDALRRPDPPAASIAIIGMACVFPQARDAATYWGNVVTGVDSVTEVPPARWDVSSYYAADAMTVDAGRKTPSKWGGFVPDVKFDALAYGIPPRSLAAIEPAQLLSLEVAANALADAGYGMGCGRELDRARVSVIVGAEGGTDLASAHGFRGLLPQYLGRVPPEVDEYLPELTEDSFPGMLTNVIAGRIANRLDLGGINYTIDAACASSLAAVDTAVKELRAGTSDVVVCGGVDLHNGINDYLLFSATHALSPRGRCASFDSSADGIALGEGVACVVLKRLEDATRDGDRVYAVIEGIAGSSDGRNLGLTAPRPEGQRLALERSYAQAGISPSEVGLVEAHGTGTVVGDRTELAVLTALFGEAGATRGSCALGSVKSQVGHTKCTAGLAGLIKVARALYHGVVPPTIHLESPNPGYEAATSPFSFHTAARPWVGRRRAAGVSAFGFGGTNFHAVLVPPEPRVHSDPAHGFEHWPTELVLLRGDTAAAAAQLGERLQRALASHGASMSPPSSLLRDLAATAWTLGSGPVRAAIVTESAADLNEKLSTAREALAEIAAGRRRDDARQVAAGVYLSAGAVDRGDGKEPPALAMLFPGQGSQRPGMLAELFVAFASMRRHLALGEDFIDVMFPPAAFTAEARQAQVRALADTRVAQPALGMTGLAVADLLCSLGIRPDLLGGHSYGELVALSAAGALSEDDLLALSVDRAESMLAAAGEDSGGMAAVAASAASVERALDGLPGVVVANDNSPSQVVISGSTDELDAAIARLAQVGLSARRIPVACAFHSSVMAGAVPRFAERLAKCPVRPPTLRVWSNATAGPYPVDPEGIRSQLTGHLTSPVRFRQQIESMYDDGARVFVEAGPGRVLTQLVGRILEGRDHLAVALDGSGRGDLRGLLTGLGQMATAGVAIDVGPLFEGRAKPIDLEGVAPAAATWVVNGHLVRTSDGQVVSGGLRPASEVDRHAARRQLSAPSSTLDARASDQREAVVLEYLRNAREVVAAGREVVLRFLGATANEIEATAETLAVRAHDSKGEPGRGLVVPDGDSRTRDQASRRSGHAMRPRLDREALSAKVASVVSDRTGYPIEMLDADLDLEADLSIDSIKRLEIIGELAEQIGLTGPDEGTLEDSVVEELVERKTLAAIVEWLAATLDSPVTGSDGVSPSVEEVPERALRFVPILTDLARPNAEDYRPLAGRTVAITDDGTGVAAALAGLLEQEGAQAQLRSGDEPLGECDVLVHAEALAPGSSRCAVGLFRRVQEAVRRGVSTVIAVSAIDGALGMDGAAMADGAPRHAGMRGVMKTLVREIPSVQARLVDLHPDVSSAEAARLVLEEIRSVDGVVEVGRAGERRCTLALDGAEPESLPLAGSVDGGLALGHDAVVLLTGGGRGVTASVGLALAREYGCRLVIIGRTPAPVEEEDSATSDARDPASLRRALIDAGWREPPAIEAECRRITASRKLRETIGRLEQAGAEVEYRCADLRNPDALGDVVRQVHQSHGRLDGIIHGAGVLEDTRLVDKSIDSFERVFDTKVCGVEALANVLGEDTRFVVLFSSVSGVFGNRGQIDYAAANDALATLARWLDGRVHGRVVAVDWGPWAGDGMVSAELEREFGRRGIGPIDPDDGVARLLAELRSNRRDPEVLIMRAAPERFGWRVTIDGETESRGPTVHVASADA